MPPFTPFLEGLGAIEKLDKLPYRPNDSETGKDGTSSRFNIGSGECGKGQGRKCISNHGDGESQGQHEHLKYFHGFTSFLRIY